jgi:hypothetical protein
MDEKEKERVRMALEDAVFRCVEAGMSRTDVREEVDYILETMDE